MLFARLLPEVGGDNPFGPKMAARLEPEKCDRNLLRCPGCLIYSALHFPDREIGLSKTINRQLFFVWLDNAFASD